MFIGTHMFAPVIGANVVDLGHLAIKRDRIFSDRDLICLAFCGILPDLLNPHISLAARMSSLTHTLWFVLAFALLVSILYFFTRHQRKLWMSAWCVFAVILHLSGDAVSGGIAPLYPYDLQHLGGRYVHYKIWFKLDLIMIACCVFLTACVKIIAKYFKNRRAEYFAPQEYSDAEYL